MCEKNINFILHKNKLQIDKLAFKILPTFRFPSLFSP